MGFRSDAELEEFLLLNRLGTGFRASVQSFYEMSKDWYRGRTEPDWDPYTKEAAMALWRRHGFTGEFWEL